MHETQGLRTYVVQSNDLRIYRKKLLIATSLLYNNLYYNEPIEESIFRRLTLN